MSNENQKEEIPERMILVSDIQGCPERQKNLYMTKLICKPQFFTSLRIFLDNNPKNKVAFVGNFFDKGGYVISTIYNIVTLRNNFPEQVHIILSFREFNKLRFIFELDKALLKQGIEEFPGQGDLEIKKIFVPIERIKDAEFSDADSKKYLNAIYTRIDDILTQTHDGKTSYSVLVHESLMNAFKNARIQGYMELMIMFQQLGSLILVYPFVNKTRYLNFLAKDEVKFMIEFLVKSIKEYFDKFCKNDDKGIERTDSIYKDLKNNLNKVYNVVSVSKEDNKENYGKTGKIPPLDTWSTICQDFYNLGKILEYDKDFSTLLCHDYALVDLFKILIPSYSLIMNGDDFDKIFKMKNKSNEPNNFKNTFALYYHKMNYYYELYEFCHNELRDLKIVEDKDELFKKKQKIQKEVNAKRKELQRKRCNTKPKPQKDMFLNFSQLFGEGKEEDVYNKFNLNEEQCELLNPRKLKVIKGHAPPEGMKQENLKRRDQQIITPKEDGGIGIVQGYAKPDSGPNPEHEPELGPENNTSGEMESQAGGAKAGSVADFLDANKSFMDINLGEYMGRGSVSGIDTFLLFINQIKNVIKNNDISDFDQAQMDMFLFLQAFYIKSFNSVNTFLDNDTLEKDKDFISFLVSQGVKFIVTGNVDTGAPFPIILEYNASGDVNVKEKVIFIAPNISKNINERMFTSYENVVEFDDDEISKYTIFRQRNYPLAIISNVQEMEASIMSLQKNGKLSNSKTHIGEFMSHTFINYFITHHFMEESMMESSGSDNLKVNEHLETKRLTAKMLPVLNMQITDTEETTYFIGNMYFIKINSSVENEHMFLILYFVNKKDIKKDSKIYYYYGDIRNWNGYFWDSYKKKLDIYVMEDRQLEDLQVNFLSRIGAPQINVPTKETLGNIDATSGLILGAKPEENEIQDNDNDNINTSYIEKDIILNGNDNLTKKIEECKVLLDEKGNQPIKTKKKGPLKRLMTRIKKKFTRKKKKEKKNK